jgi:hypothetical protein
MKGVEPSIHSEGELYISMSFNFTWFYSFNLFIFEFKPVSIMLWTKTMVEKWLHIATERVFSASNFNNELTEKRNLCSSTIC